MFRTGNDVVFSLDIAGFSYGLQVLEFRAWEALSEPYGVRLELANDPPGLAADMALQGARERGRP